MCDEHLQDFIIYFLKKNGSWLCCLGRIEFLLGQDIISYVTDGYTVCSVFKYDRKFGECGSPDQVIEYFYNDKIQLSIRQKLFSRMHLFTNKYLDVSDTSS